MQRAKSDKDGKDIQQLLEYLDKFGNSIFELSQEDSAKIKDERKRRIFSKAR
jgi:hypothetical protein